MKNAHQNFEKNSRRHFIQNVSLAVAGFYMKPATFKNIILSTKPKNITRYGCLFQGLKPNQAEKKMQDAGFDLVRVPIFLKDASWKKVLDDYLIDGYSVQINVNWQQTTVPSNFPEPEDFPILIERGTEFLEHYVPYKDQIPLLCFGNEWDNLNYHTNDIINYLNALELGTSLAHLYGFKVADAGITSTGIQRWMYSQLSGAEAVEWKKNYWVGENNPNYQPLLDKINFYISQVKNIPIDYLNVHWYNDYKSSNGFPKAAGTYLKQCDKKEIATNEFGILTNDFDLWQETVEEVSSFELNGGLQATQLALAYSGQNKPKKAIELTDKMLKLLANQATSDIIS